MVILNKDTDVRDLENAETGRILVKCSTGSKSVGDGDLMVTSPVKRKNGQSSIKVTCCILVSIRYSSVLQFSFAKCFTIDLFFIFSCVCF